MALLLFDIFGGAPRAAAVGAFPAVAIDLELDARGTRTDADEALIDDGARADDGFCARTGVFGIVFVGLDGFHARIENGLHLLHGLDGTFLSFFLLYLSTNLDRLGQCDIEDFASACGRTVECARGLVPRTMRSAWLLLSSWADANKDKSDGHPSCGLR